MIGHPAAQTFDLIEAAEYYPEFLPWCASATILARDDTREMLDSLLLHIGAAYETEIWGQVRKFIVLDVVNDLLALTVRTSLLHLMSAE